MAGLSSRAEQENEMSVGHNGVDATVLNRWTGEILRVHQSLEDQRMENMRICKDIRERLPDLYESAVNAGLPKKAFKAHVKAELAKLKYERLCEKIVPEDEDDREAYEALRAVAEAGDLFDHAASKLAGDEEDVRPRSLREKEAARIARENTERLQAGMSGLPGAEATEA
jgi:hypothetical protein